MLKECIEHKNSIPISHFISQMRYNLPPVVTLHVRFACHVVPVRILLRKGLLGSQLAVLITLNRPFETVLNNLF